MKKKVTIQDIARTANVSKSTVSRVLNGNAPVNEAKKKAVLAAIDEPVSYTHLTLPTIHLV